ncbi:sensor domain-containing diguanylate cyclase [Pseudoalteromonas pernae]|uniref:sensor domain-containing diguanylate cyclase n=1 Tax=Pseudoalteromonas pernae TaxID=3118054 RepID=UPI003242AB41
MNEENTDQLKAQISQLKFALDNVPAYVYIKNEHSLYVYANKQTLDLFGCSEDTLEQFGDHDLFPADTVKNIRDSDAKVLVGERTKEEVVVPYPDGRKAIYWEVKTPLFSVQEPNKIVGILGVSTDITKRRDLEEQLKHAASSDALTGLLNRRYFFDRLTHALQLSKRYQSSGGVICISTDKFKSITYDFGHAAGDAYLIEVANRLRHVTREADSIASLGDGEFAVLVEGLSADQNVAHESVEHIADKIESVIAREYSIQGVTYTGAAHTGIAMFLGEQKSADEIIAEADKQMRMIKGEQG